MRLCVVAILLMTAIVSFGQYSPSDWLTLSDRPDVKAGYVSFDWMLEYGLYRSVYGTADRIGLGEGASINFLSMPIRVAYATRSGALEFAIAPKMTSVRFSYYLTSASHGDFDDTWITAKFLPFPNRPVAFRLGVKLPGTDEVSPGRQVDFDVGALGRFLFGSVEAEAVASYRLRTGEGLRTPPIDAPPEDTLFLPARWGNELHGRLSIEAMLFDGFWLGGTLQGYTASEDQPADGAFPVESKRWRVSVGPSLRFNVGSRGWAMRILVDAGGREDFSGVSLLMSTYASRWPIPKRESDALPEDLR
jgi:hypothetical protein